MSTTTENHTLDAPEAFELLERAVATRGRDYNYLHANPAENEMLGPRCRYEKDGGPSCVVGVALSLGKLAPLDTLRFLDNAEPHDEGPLDEAGYPLDPDPSIDTTWTRLVLAEKANLALTPEAATLLRRAQSAQDRGHSWGDALNLAREYLDNLPA